MCERPPRPRRFGTGIFSRGAHAPPHEEGNLPLLRLYVQSRKEGNTLSVTFVTVVTSRPANVGPPTSQAEPRYCRKPCSRYPRPEERGLSPIPAECILGDLSRSDWLP